MKKIFKKWGIIGLIILLGLAFVFPKIANAAALTTLSDVLTRTQKSQASSHDISFTLGGSTTLDAGETVAIDFHEDDSGFTVAGASTAVADLGFNDGTERTILNVGGACSDGANNMIADVNDTTGILTFTACTGFTSSGSGATINVEYGTAAGGTNRVTNPGTADSYLIDITAAGDTGKLAAAIADNDQFTVTASVDPSITMSLSATSTDFGTLSSSSVTTASPNITVTIDTNAGSGYSISVQDAGDTSNPGLYNAAATYMIGSADYSYSNSADLSSVAGYGIQCSSASATCQAPYNVSGDNVGGYELSAQPFATYSAPASSHTITLTSKAKVTGATPAGSYSDTVTVITTGNF